MASALWLVLLAPPAAVSALILAILAGMTAGCEWPRSLQVAKPVLVLAAFVALTILFCWPMYPQIFN